MKGNFIFLYVKQASYRSFISKEFPLNSFIFQKKYPQIPLNSFIFLEKKSFEFLFFFAEGGMMPVCSINMDVIGYTSQKLLIKILSYHFYFSNQDFSSTIWPPNL